MPDAVAEVRAAVGQPKSEGRVTSSPGAGRGGDRAAAGEKERTRRRCGWGGAEGRRPPSPAARGRLRTSRSRPRHAARCLAQDQALIGSPCHWGRDRERAAANPLRGAVSRVGRWGVPARASGACAQARRDGDGQGRRRAGARARACVCVREREGASGRAPGGAERSAEPSRGRLRPRPQPQPGRAARCPSLRAASPSSGFLLRERFPGEPPSLPLPLRRSPPQLPARPASASPPSARLPRTPAGGLILPPWLSAGAWPGWPPTCRTRGKWPPSSGSAGLRGLRAGPRRSSGPGAGGRW